MSVPYIAFECTGCALTGTNAVTWGFFAYGHEDGLSVDRRTGFCTDCDDIVAVEAIAPHLAAPSNADLDEEEAEERSIARFWLWRRALIHLFRFLGGEGTPRSRRAAREAEARARAAKHAVHAAEHARLVALGRAPVCLHCGGTDVTPIPLPRPFADDGRLHRTGVRHPGCGGEFLVRGSNGDRIGVALETRIYDLATGRQLSGPGGPSPLTVAVTQGARPATWSP